MPTVLSAVRSIRLLGSAAARPAGRAGGGLARIVALAVSCVATQAALAAGGQPGLRGSSFTVGGTVGGMVGTDLVLSLNGGNNLLVGANGGFTFAQALNTGSTYDVTVVQQPVDPTQICTVSNGSGTIGAGNVTDVQVDCAQPEPHLVLTVTDDHAYARFGMTMNYVVTLTNDGTGEATGVSIANVSPPQLDAGLTTWTCVGAGEGATCSSAGSGALSDSGIALPVGRSLAWLVTAPMRADATGDTLDYTVDASGAGTASATDSDVLVLLRTGMDVPYSDGAEGGAQPPAP
jgi:uncharacterized repeat protein (TIGR01451 family)